MYSFHECSFTLLLLISKSMLNGIPWRVFFSDSVILVTNSTATNGTISEVTTIVYTPSLHDLQVYGVIVTILLCFIVFGGVKIINRVAPAFLIPVLFSLFCIFIGVFSAPRSNASSKIPLLNTFFIWFYIPNLRFSLSGLHFPWSGIPEL